MGRKPWSNRRVVEDCRVLDIAVLVRSGLFSPWIDSNGYRHEPSRTMEWTSGLSARVTLLGRYVDGDRFTPTATIDEVKFSYEVGGREIEQRIQVASTQSKRNGKRYYFLCPGWDGHPCQERVGKLYLPPGEGSFCCRACHDLTYRSVKEHDKRVDALIRSPRELGRALRCSSPRSASLALRAVSRLVRTKV
jgi:hypothetical protein